MNIKLFGQCLTSSETRDRKDASDVMLWTITSIKDLKRPSPDALLLSILWHYANEKVDADGALLGHHQSHEVHWLTEDERKTLEQTLTAIRSDCWFADWIALQVASIATANHPADRYPSPLKIAASLVDCIQEHEAKMDAAREMVRMRPDLLFPAPAEPPAAPAPPAAPETTTRAAKQPAKAPHARKTQKKAGHA